MKYIVYVIIIACLLQESLVACRGGHGGGGGGRGGGGGSRGGSSRGGSSRGGSSYSGGGGRSYSGSSSSSRGGALDAWVYIPLAFGLTSVIVIASLVLCFCCGKKSKNQSGVIISVPPDAKNGDCKFSAANNARCDDDNNNAKNNKVTGIQSETIDMSYLGTYNLDTNERGTRNINRDPTVKTSYIDMSGLPNYFDVVNGATPQLNTSTLPKYSNVANGDTPQLKRTPKTPYSKGKRFVQYKKITGVFIL